MQERSVADCFFCTCCETFIPNPNVGTKAGLFKRWFATFIDPFCWDSCFDSLSVMAVGGVLGTLEQGIFGLMGVSILAILVVTVMVRTFALLHPPNYGEEQKGSVEKRQKLRV